MLATNQFISLAEWPRIAAFLVLGPFVFGNLCSWLRRRYDLDDGYSRKLHHIGLMLISGPLLAVLPDQVLLPSLVIASTGLIAISIVAAYSRAPLLFGMAEHSMRRRDAPHSRFFFLMPMITSNIAILVSAFLYPLALVKVAFFSVAIADGMAEPVGVRFGRSNTYRVRDVIWGNRNTKSLAGSATVFALSAAVCAGVLGMVAGPAPVLLPLALGYGLVATAIEAVSPRGMDNMLLMLLSPAFLLAGAAWLP